MQAIVVAGAVLQQQRRRLGLSRLATAREITRVLARIAQIDRHCLVPAVGNLRERRIERSPSTATGSGNG
jgi:hypothetical protein